MPLPPNIAPPGVPQIGNAGIQQQGLQSMMKRMQIPQIQPQNSNLAALQKFRPPQQAAVPRSQPGQPIAPPQIPGVPGMPQGVPAPALPQQLQQVAKMQQQLFKSPGNVDVEGFKESMEELMKDMPKELTKVMGNLPFTRRDAKPDDLDAKRAGVRTQAPSGAEVRKSGAGTDMNKIADMAVQNGISRGPELNHFMAQMAHESGGFKHLEELGSKKYFNRYEGRRDLGNTEKGDGYKFRGRGFIQLTGRDNYKRYGDQLGLDLVNNPELASKPENAMKIATQYWKNNNLGELAERNDIRGITKRIQGAQGGLRDRQRWLNRFNQMDLGVKAPDVAKNATVGERPDVAPIVSGLSKILGL